MKTTIDVIIALLPIAMLFGGFLVLKLNAFEASFCAWILELVVVLAYYHLTPLRVAEASLWGALSRRLGLAAFLPGR